MRTCLQGHPGCGYIGDVPHESIGELLTPREPGLGYRQSPIEERIREIVREELDLGIERLAGALIKGLQR